MESSLISSETQKINDCIPKEIPVSAARIYQIRSCLHEENNVMPGLWTCEKFHVFGTNTQTQIKNVWKGKNDFESPFNIESKVLALWYVFIWKQNQDKSYWFWLTVGLFSCERNSHLGIRKINIFVLVET